MKFLELFIVVFMFIAAQCHLTKSHEFFGSSYYPTTRVIRRTSYVRPLYRSTYGGYGNYGTGSLYGSRFF